MSEKAEDAYKALTRLCMRLEKLQEQALEVGRASRDSSAELQVLAEQIREADDWREKAEALLNRDGSGGIPELIDPCRRFAVSREDALAACRDPRSWRGPLPDPEAWPLPVWPFGTGRAA